MGILAKELFTTPLRSQRTGGLVIQAETNTMIDSNVVPVLTADQVIAAYNAVVAGVSCTITDAEGMANFVVLQGVNTANEVSVFILYFDRLILQYYEDGQITHTPISVG